MSLSCSASFLKPLAELAAGEKPYLAVRITPHAVATAAPRRPFHLALLIDVSGSMEGERITAVRKTLELLVEALHDDDVLTLISYQSSAEVIAQGQDICETSRAGLLVAVNNLAANGGTNLEAAISALYGITHPTASCTGLATAPVDAVFLLTDGYINQGQTTPAVLQSMLTAAVPAGTPVHTLGYGADHNARMLRDIALRTRASYTYADASELLPSIVGDILGGLETEVGRCGRLLFGGEGWVCAEPVASASGHDFGTLIAGKDQWIVLEGAVGTTVGPTQLTVSWRNAAGETLFADVVFGESDITAVQVAEQIARVSVAKGLADTGAKLEAGQRAEALTVLEALRSELTASVAHDSLLVVQLLAQVEEMLATVRRTPSLGGARGGGFGMAPLLSRMASNTAALTCQRGYVSMVQSQAPEEEEPYEPQMSAGAAAVGGGSATAAAPRTPSAAPYAFASPTQRTMTNAMRSRYSERE